MALNFIEGMGVFSEAFGMFKEQENIGTHEAESRLVQTLKLESDSTAAHSCPNLEVLHV